MTIVLVFLFVLVITAVGVVRCDSEDDHQHEHNIPILGGYSATDVNDESVHEMATFATNKLSQVLNTSPGSLFAMRVVQAETQIVSGTNYKMELELKELSENKTADTINCKVIVYDQSWTGLRQLTSCSCCGDSWSAGLPEKITTPLPVLDIESLPTLLNDVADDVDTADNSSTDNHPINSLWTIIIFGVAYLFLFV